MKAYKGFNQNMTCRGFQYKEGETYETERASVCECGFHACENPMDCLGYYDPDSSVYHEVDMDGEIDRAHDDTKIAATKIKIGARLSIAGLVKAAFDFIRSKCTDEHNAEPGKAASAGAYGAASAGESGAASAGAYGAASAGYRGAASAGAYGAASAGYRGAASAGAYGAASAGDRGAASAGVYGAASAGYRGAASAGAYGAASAGYRGAASAGAYGAAVSRGSASVEKDGIACVRGNGVRVKGGIGAILVVAEECLTRHEVKCWKAFVIDGEKYKVDTWYVLRDGEIVEVEDNQ